MSKPLLFEVSVERNHDGSWLSTKIDQHMMVVNGSDDVDALEQLVDLVQDELGPEVNFHFLLVEMKPEIDGQ